MLSWRTRTGGRAPIATAGIVLLLLLPVVTASSVHTAQARSGQSSSPVEATSCNGGTPRVCVHPAYAALLPELSTKVRQALAPIEGIPGAPERVEQALRPGVSQVGVVRFTMFGAQGGPLATSPVVAQVIYGLTGAYCEGGSGVTPGAATKPRRQVAAWLLAEAGLQAVQGLEPGELRDARRVAALSDAKRRAWLTEHLAVLADCQASVTPLLR